MEIVVEAIGSSQWDSNPQLFAPLGLDPAPRAPRGLPPLSAPPAPHGSPRLLHPACCAQGLFLGVEMWRLNGALLQAAALVGTSTSMLRHTSMYRYHSRLLLRLLYNHPPYGP